MTVEGRRTSVGAYSQASFSRSVPSSFVPLQTALSRKGSMTARPGGWPEAQVLFKSRPRLE
jgi:hypothetical protein